MSKPGKAARFLAVSLMAGIFSGRLLAGPWSDKKMTMTGEGYRFSVSPPEGWSVRTGNPPRFRYQAELMKWPRARGVTVPKVTIDVKIKTGKEMARELDDITVNYRKKHGDASISDLKIAHGDYPVAAKSLGIAGKYHEYIVFMDPGKAVHYWIVARMMSMQKPAGDSEMKSFKSIVESVTFLGEFPVETTRTGTGTGKNAE